MSEMTPEEQAERIRRLQERRGTAADAPDVRKKRRRKHGMRTRVVVTALSVASFASLLGAMTISQSATTSTVAAAANTAAVSSGTTSGSTTSGTTNSGTTSATTATNSTTSSNTSSATSGTSSTSSTAKAVTSTKGS